MPTTLEVFLFKEASGEYAGPYMAHESPLEAGSFIEPICSTRLPVPAFTEKQVAVFVDDAWVVKDDYRYVQLFFTADGAPTGVDSIGPLPSGVTDKPRPSQSHVWQSGNWVIDPVSLKLELWEAIKAERDRRTEKSGFLVAGKWYHTDIVSKTQHLGNKDTARDQLAGGGAMTDALLDPETGEEIVWKTMGGVWQPLTCQIAFDIVKAGKGAEFAHFKAAEVHKAAMEASANPGAYQFSTGWPVAFEELPE